MLRHARSGCRTCRFDERRVCRLAEAVLEETVAHMVAAVLANIKAITDESVARMDADVADVSRFFGRFLKAERVCTAPAPVAHALRNALHPKGHTCCNA